MTDAAALRAAIEKADGACECRRGCYFCDFSDAIDKRTQGICGCTSTYASRPAVIVCRWPGHTLVREVVRAAAEFGGEWAFSRKNTYQWDRPGLKQELSAILGEK